MSLIRKNLTPRLLAANQSNSRKSTGPRTELGKRHASRNAGKHLVFARVLPPYIKELGEDPAGFEKLRESLREAFEPQDAFEEMLVGEMAENRWRRQRLLRAEAGILTRQRRDFVIRRQLRAINEQKGPAKPIIDEALATCGLLGRSGSYGSSVQILEALVQVKLTSEHVGFRKDSRFLLQRVSKLGDTWLGGCLLADFDECCDHPESNRSEEQEEERRHFLQELESEIASYRKLVELYKERDIETPQPVVDAQLLPEQEALDKIVRYEAALERQFERKLQLLVAWRKERGEALPAQLSLVEGPEKQS